MCASEQTVVMPDNTQTASRDVIEYGQSAEANAAILFFEAESRQVNLDEGTQIILGRIHPTNAVDPLVDLTPYDAAPEGVSRLHAAIRRDQVGWWIIDLDSSNGTWLNGQRLEPHQQYPLKGSNRVRFAGLVFRIKLIHEY